MSHKINIGRIPVLIFVGILLLGFSHKVSAQDTTIVTGKVFDHMKRPLKDISVSIAGSFELPYVTNENGEFTIFSTSPSDWIILSPANTFKAKRVYLNGRKQLDIYLTALDMASDEDEVIIMSRPVKKRNIAAAFSSVDMKFLTGIKPVTIDEYFQGLMAGANVVKRSGHPSSGAFMTIRGINSLNAGNQPLYIVDGIPATPNGVFSSNVNGFTFNPMVEVNPHDVSALTVIKDPAITAAYGSRGSNGLVLIETLDPSVTQTVIQLDLNTGLLLAPADKIPQLNATQHKTLLQEVLFSSGKLEENLILEYPNLYLEPDDKRFIDYQHNTNWQNEIFRNSLSQNVNIMVKGGDEIATYGLSFGLMNNSGVIKKTDYKGYNLRFVSKLNVFRWMKMNAGVSLNYNKSNMKDAATSRETSPILTALGKSPMLNPYQYDEQGKEITTVAEVDELGVSNPVAVINNYEAKNTNTSFVYYMGMDATINSRISLKSKFNFTYNMMKEQIFQPNHGMEHYYNNEAHNVAKAATDVFRSFYNNTYLNINRSIGEHHNLSSMTGFNLQTNNFEYDWGLTKNAPMNDQYRTLADGRDDLREIGGQNRKWNWFSLYENLFYSYKDKYIITASLSFDGSSRVGNDAANTIKLGDVPFGLFYSAGVAWRLSSESFLKNNSWLEDFKWRLSYGMTGNDDIGESSASNYYKAVRFRETVGLYPAVITNTKLTYEKVSQLNTGIDISLWGNRFSGTVDVFRSQTKNMLIYSPVNPYMGYDYRMENSGKMKNTGYEFSLFGRLMDKKEFKWDVQVFLTHVKNSVIDIKGSKLITELNGLEIVNMEGAPANSFYGYVFRGVFASTTDAEASGLINDKGMPYHAGDAIYADLSGPLGTPDGVINNFDKKAIGSSLPDLTGSVVNSFSYKGFTLNAIIQFVTGNELFNFVRYNNERMSGLDNQSQYVLNRWQYEGQVTDVPRALWNDPMGNSAFSTRWIEDGSYVRLKNVSISYKLPKEFLTFKSAEFYASANNLMTLTKYLGYDPEFSYSYMQIHQGIDYGMTPQSRQFIVGVKLGL
ncbi:MAG TPA: SusC/RagA family TonB-linked outer membrane protein [Bacteroidales bacterium]|nr:SusC/RagA family TonB-linked outer membrane protein [Bacteroidales bacterium]